MRRFLDITTEINRGYIPTPKAVAPPVSLLRRIRLSLTDLLRLIFVPLVFVAAAFLQAYLRRRLRNRPASGLPDFHRRAIAQIPEFLSQYPFHLYPVIAKSFELAYLTDELRRILGPSSRIVEVAIGEGTLSARVFPAGSRVLGLDLNPYHLVKAARRPHVAQAVICDCLAPPVRPGHFDLLISNNFMHHVTRKGATLETWAPLAGRVLFNDNSPTWTTGQVIPYLLRQAGLQGLHEKMVAWINSRFLQCLEPRAVLDGAVAGPYEIESAVSFFSERTYFLANIFSFLLLKHGPPTPPVTKAVFNHLLGPATRTATRTLAELLMRFDLHEDRRLDSFISYLGRSRAFRVVEGDGVFLCPSCRGPLEDEKTCAACGIEYERRDGMTFLLTQDFAHILRDYVSEEAAVRPDEQL